MQNNPLMRCVLCFLMSVVLLGIGGCNILSPPSKVGDTWTNSVDMKFTAVPAGEFVMGSSESEQWHIYNEMQQRMKLSKPFYLGVFAVTQGQWRAVMGKNPSDLPIDLKADDDLPVNHVSWDDAVAFCQKLSEKEGHKYRLPTEAQWEYACRAGTTTRYNTGDDENALKEAGWYGSNSDNKPHSVGQKKQNAWGFYDMHGNVWQWCADWYYERYPEGDVVHTPGAGEGTLRVLRGGCWSAGPAFCRSACRRGNTPSTENGNTGFRVALDFP